MTVVEVRSPHLSGTNIKEPPLLERLRRAALERGAARPTADALVSWARAFILFHNKRHPREMGRSEATHFLEHVVKSARDPLPTQEMSNRRAGRRLSQGTKGSRTRLGPTWYCQERRTFQPRYGLRPPPRPRRP
jgi:hypothetical protein